MRKMLSLRPGLPVTKIFWHKYILRFQAENTLKTSSEVIRVASIEQQNREMCYSFTFSPRSAR